MKAELDKLGRDDLEELSKIILTFMDHLHPITSSNSWILDFYLRFDSQQIFKWVGFIDRLIDLPFPTIIYRDKSHQLGELLQKKFDEENIPVKLRHPLFFFIGTFYQIFDTQALIYLKITNAPDKIKAFLKLDPYLISHIKINFEKGILAITPGFTHPYDILEYVLSTHVFDIELIDLFTARLGSIPSFVSKVNQVNFYLYKIESGQMYPSSGNYDITYL